MTQKAKTVTVPMVGAVSILIATIIITFGVFILPVYIGYKVYLYWSLCFITCFMFRFNEWFKRVYKKYMQSLTLTATVTTCVVFGLMFWCGFVIFSQFWLSGGSDPFFHHSALFYVSSLSLLIVYWGIVLLISPVERTFFTIMHSFRIWTYGFIWMHTGMLIMLIIFEGD